jgi:glycogen synthase
LNGIIAVVKSELAVFQPEIIHVWNLGGLSKSLMFTLQTCGRPVVYDVSDHWIARSLKQTYGYGGGML